MKVIATLIIVTASLTSAQINYDTLAENSWMQVQSSGEFPNSGGDVLAAIDTAGNFYMFGGCTYGNGAGGTHNSDIYRVDLNTGEGVRLSNCSNNVWGWRGSCQCGHAYDINRNCIWVSGGTNPACGNGQNGLWKFQCPNGPYVRMADDAGGKFLKYDPVNDLLYKTDQYKLNIFDCQTNQWLASANYPFSMGWEISRALVSCTFDTKRGLMVITMCRPIPNGTPRNDVYCYNGATGEWHTKSPPEKPSFNEGSLAYDPVNDLYVYFGGGTCPSELWVYSYDANKWTQMPANGRAYNDNDPGSSTWPPYRTQNTWDYSPKHNVFAVWGTTTWLEDKTCVDDGIAKPFWFYRVGARDSTVQEPGWTRDVCALDLEVWPNPFATSTAIYIRGKRTEKSGKMSIFDINGKLIEEMTFLSSFLSYSWNTSGCPAGVYFVQAKLGNKIISKKLFVTK